MCYECYDIEARYRKETNDGDTRCGGSYSGFMSGEVVWSINIMIAILLIAVGYSIYWIFMYDSWYPNDGTQSGNKDSSFGSEGRTHDGSCEGTDP